MEWDSRKAANCPLYAAGPQKLPEGIAEGSWRAVCQPGSTGISCVPWSKDPSIKAPLDAAPKAGFQFLYSFRCYWPRLVNMNVKSCSEFSHFPLIEYECQGMIDDRYCALFRIHPESWRPTAYVSRLFSLPQYDDMSPEKHPPSVHEDQSPAGG